MNRFVYLVHAEYRDPVGPAPVARIGAQPLPEKLARISAELRRYLPDTRVRILDELIRRDPDVIQVTVVTTLDEATAEAAFVRYIRDCKATLFQ